MIWLFMGMAALSEMVSIVFGGDKSAWGPEMLCGIFCAGCILGTLGEILGMFM